jgi:hypothetical protein
MRNIILAAAILFVASSISYGQNPVTDTHPGATIYIYDPQSGQEVLTESNDAVSFKDALVDLVSSTAEARMIAHTTPGHKTILITQAAPTQGNAYQVEMDSKLFGQTSTVYTFSYNVDQNTLYYLDPNSQTWITERIADNNMSYLNDSYNLGKFNDPQNWNRTVDDGTGDTPVVQANTPPPPLQDYQQPPCPVDGYLWQPGYWAFNRYNGGYYWVSGTWVAPPNPGYLWTPPYWGYEDGVYAFHGGYWGVSIGFYGGINYGYGYGGRGYYGGAWEGNHFRYNTAVVNVNTTVVHNTYVDRTVIVNNTVINNKKVSFNGPGGVEAKPTPEEAKVAAQPHVKDFSQDPKAPKPIAKPMVAVQRGVAPNANTAKTPGVTTQKTPGAAIQKAPAAANAPKVPSNVPGMPRGPGSGIGGQKPVQGQTVNPKGGKQQPVPAKTDKTPPPSNDKKK